MKLPANLCGVIAGLTIVCMAAAPTHGQEKPSPTQGKKPGAVFKAPGSFTLAVPVPEELAMLRFHSPLVEPDVRVTEPDPSGCSKAGAQSTNRRGNNSPRPTSGWSSPSPSTTAARGCPSLIEFQSLVREKTRSSCGAMRTYTLA